MISANGKECSSLSHTELITFLRNIGNENCEIESILYRDASGTQTPITPPVISHPESSNDLFPAFQESSNKVTTMSHPNLPMFLNASSSHSTPGGSGKNQKRLRQEAKEMVCAK